MATYEVSYQRKNTGHLYSTGGYKIASKFVKWSDLKRGKSKAEVIKSVKANAPKGSKNFIAKRRLY